MNTKVIPERLQEIRPLSYTGFGIDIVDVGGNAIGRSADTDLIPDANILCTRFSPARTEIPLQNRPPRSLDTLYLLDRFLLGRFPLGGTFRSASKVRKPGSTEDLQTFVAFVKRPEYIGHPWDSFWVSCFDNDYKWDNKIIGKNLAVLRSVRTVSTHTRQGAGKIAETSYILGPPGTSGAEKKEGKGKEKRKKRAASSDDEAGGLEKPVSSKSRPSRSKYAPTEEPDKKREAKKRGSGNSAAPLSADFLDPPASGRKSRKLVREE
ncbi:hypothetical protein D6D02_08685 [Aureobasidium pullulans]|nr:hypothetical protein D6D02_08685 [Aureobasidium pullulans]